MKLRVLLLVVISFLAISITNCSHKLSEAQQTELNSNVNEVKANYKELKDVKAQKDAVKNQTVTKKKKLAKQEKEKIRIMKQLGYEIPDSTSNKGADSTKTK